MADKLMTDESREAVRQRAKTRSEFRKNLVATRLIKDLVATE
jgi:hypothetical protein